MQHTKLSENDRDQIGILKASGLGIREISRRLNRSPSSISDEIKRNSYRGYYVPIHAQNQYKTRQSKANRNNPLKDKKIFKYVEEKLQSNWSPEQISGRLKLDNPEDPSCWVSYECIYQYIYDDSNKKFRLREYLPRHHSKRRKKNGRRVHKSAISNRVSIHNRPEEINTREVFGHYEGDTVEGINHKDGLHTEVERKSRKLFVRKIEKISSEESIKAQRDIFANLPAESRLSTTLDNGKENHLHYELKVIGMDTYFCDPYSSWQKGTNENTNGLVRRYYPKKTDFSKVADDEIAEVVDEINNRPRKVLKYYTPNEVFDVYLNNVRIGS